MDMDEAATSPTSRHLRLDRPSIERLEEYRSMIDMARARGESGDGYNLPVTSIIRRQGPHYLRRLEEVEAGINLPDTLVPMSTRWLIDHEGRVVGETRIRHRLTPPLEIEGGHVGYFVHPDHRGRGYGREILRLALIELHRLGIDRVLVTCNADNFRSRRVIEANGGRFDHYTVSPASGKQVMRYWIAQSRS